MTALIKLLQLFQGLNPFISVAIILSAAMFLALIFYGPQSHASQGCYRRLSYRPEKLPRAMKIMKNLLVIFLSKYRWINKFSVRKM